MKDAYFIYGMLVLVVATAAAYGVRVMVHGVARSERVAKIGGTPILGQELMDWTYWAMSPIVRGLSAARITPNMLTWAACVLGFGAGIALGFGWFGLAVALATWSTLGDILDGQVARMTNTGSDRGELLDAAVDRYTELAFLSGLVIYYRDHVLLILLSLAALCASFMISYASAKAEALQVNPPRGLMRRHERAVYLICGAGFSALFGDWLVAHNLPWTTPMIAALLAVAVIGNAAAVIRLVRIGQALPQMTPMYEETATLPRSESPVVRLLAFLGPDFTFFLFFLGVFIALGLIFGSTFHVAGEGSIAIVTSLAGGLVGVRFAYRARSIVMNTGDERAKFYAAARRILRDWGPMILLVVLFENLHQYTGLIRKIPIDEHLYNLDVSVFGVEPSVWVGKHLATPLLTDWFAMAYGMYFILPMILATALSVRGRRADFRELATSVVLHLCIGFTCFILFPAGPPRFYGPLMHGGFDPPHLTSFFGLWEWSQGQWDAANPVRTNSSFPSMHCAIAMMTLLYGWRFGSAVFPRRPRLFFWLCLPIVVSLWFSTVYLRHHWVPDCLAGMLVGVCCFRLTPVVRRLWPGAEAAVNT